MRSRALHTICQFLKKRETEKVSLFLEKRHGEREMEKLKAIRLLLCTRHDANYTINIEIY